MLLTNTQVSRLHKAFANDFPVHVKFLITQLHKIGQSGRFLGKFLGPLPKTGLPLMKTVLKPSAKSVLIPLGFTAAASEADGAIYKKRLGFGTTILIISNEEMTDIMKIVKSLEKSDLLIKDLNKTIKNEKKEQKGGFLSMLLGTLGASLLANLLTGKVTIRASKSILRLGWDF